MHSRSSFRSDASSKEGGIGGGGSEDIYGQLSNINKLYRLTEGGRVFDFLGNGKALHYQIAIVADELLIKAWRFVRENTETSITHSADWFDQDLKLVKSVLAMDVCSVPEISLFRALNEWAEHQCKIKALPPLPEHRRMILGEDTIELVRFPVMSVEELQWEVVPTGLLEYRDVMTVQKAITAIGGGRVFTRFNHELRFSPVAELVQMRNKGMHALEIDADMVRRERRLSSRAPSPDSLVKGQARTSSRPLYTPAEDDEVDHMLATKLLRGHVEAFVDEQLEAGLAEEAGVPVDADTRPVLLGDPFKDQPRGGGVRGQIPPHRRFKKSVYSDPSPMLLLTRRLQPQAPQSSMATADVEEQGVARLPARANDFHRMSPGLYRFRDDRVLEMKMERGDPVVYERKQDLADFDDDDTFALDEEVELYATRENAGSTRMPLSEFLCQA